MEEHKDLFIDLSDDKLLSFCEDDFNFWFNSFKKLKLSREEIHKLIEIKNHFLELHFEVDKKNEVSAKDYELLKALCIDMKQIDLNVSDISDILDLLLERNYRKIKDKHLLIHQAFCGIPDLGSSVLSDLHEEFKIKNFDELTKAIVMLHYRPIYNANYEWLINVDSPSLSDCVCFKEEVNRLDSSNNNFYGFLNDAGMIPHKDWVIEHTKAVIVLARKYIEDPYKFYVAYFSTHKESLSKIDLNKDLIKQLINTRDYDVETTCLVLIDAAERGFDIRHLMEARLDG